MFIAVSLNLSECLNILSYSGRRRRRRRRREYDEGRECGEGKHFVVCEAVRILQLAVSQINTESVCLREI